VVVISSIVAARIRSRRVRPGVSVTNRPPDSVVQPHGHARKILREPP
jgi:hypothetical protein